MRRYITVLALLMAGCQSPASHPKRPPPTQQEMQAYGKKECVVPPEGTTAESCQFLSALQYGIQRNFYDYNRYIGQQCSVTIRWSRQNRYDVLNTTGDEKLCKKAWGVIGSADYLPPPPADLPAEMMIDFRPQ